MNKQELRLRLRKKRKNIPNKEEKSLAVYKRFIDTQFYQRALHILAFWGKNSEINTTPLIKKILEEQKQLYLPFISELTIGKVKDLRDTRLSSFDVKVPRTKADASIYERIDIIIIPGLAFTRGGARLGHGMGWYDKFLTKIPTKTLLVGLSYDELLIDSLPLEKHDKKVDIIVTPTETIIINEQKLQYDQNQTSYS